MQNFRQLIVWRRAHAFALEVRRVTETFPRSGYTELKSQLRRAAQSIVDNIVEGSAASSRMEFARYLDISIKSTSEVDYQLQYAHDVGVLAHDVWVSLTNEAIEIRKMLSALRRTVVRAAHKDVYHGPRLPQPKSAQGTKQAEETGTDD